MSAGVSVGRLQRFVPIPHRVSGRAKYPLRSMIVSESFTVKAEDLEKLSNSLTSCISSVERKTGRKFTMRRTADRSGIAVWRIR